MPVVTGLRHTPPRTDPQAALDHHAAAFTLVNALLFAIDALTPGGWWFQWPLLAWGTLLLLHALVTLGAMLPRSAARDDRELRRWIEIHRMR